MRDVVIVGDGAVGWLAGAMIAAALVPTGRRVTVVPTGGPDLSLGAVGPAVLIGPRFGARMGEVAPDEAALLRAGRGNLILAQRFDGWHAPGGGFAWPYGSTGLPIGPVAFPQMVHRVRAGGRPVRLSDFSLAALAAGAERFAMPVDDPASPRSTLGYGIAVTLDGLAASLRAQALVAGATCATGRFAVAEERGDGTLAGVRTDAGVRVPGDLFVDASGPARLLFRDRQWDDWSGWFPVNRVVTSWCDMADAPVGFATTEASDPGWHRSIPLDGGRAEMLCYAADSLSDDAAVVRLRATDARCHPVRSGRLDRSAIGNRIALGAAATELPSLFAGTAEQAEAEVADVLTLFPANVEDRVSIAEIDRLARERAERWRDLHLVFPHLADRDGSAWRSARGRALPEEVAYKLSLYRSRGRVPMLDGEPVEAGDWTAILDGLGLRARRRDAQADLIPERVLLDHFARLRHVLDGAVRAMPPHAAALRAAKGGPLSGR